MDVDTRAFQLGISAARILRTARTESIENANTALRRISNIPQRLPSSRIQPRNPLVSVPRAILSRLLEHCNLLDRIAIAQTCVDLRLVSQSLPHLWSKIRVITPLALCNASRFLQWSYPRLVDIRLELDAGCTFEAFAAFVMATFHLVESLTLTVIKNGAYDYDMGRVLGQRRNVWADISRALSWPAPHMHSLDLTVLADDVTVKPCLPRDLLNGDPGVLRTCRLHGLRPPPFPEPCNALSMLRTLDFRCDDHDITANELAHLISYSAAIETFGLRTSSFITDGAVSDVVTPARLPRLRRIAIELYTSAYLEKANVVVRRFRGLEEVIVVATILPTSPLHDQLHWPGPLRAYLPAYSLPTIKFGHDTHGDGSGLRVKLRTSFDGGWSSAPILASPRLISLVVHEHLVSSSGSLPSAPNLVELCIVFANRTEITKRRKRVYGVLETTDLVFDYPALATLRFAYIPLKYSHHPVYGAVSPILTLDPDSSCSVALTDLVDFIRDRVRVQPPGRRLDLLTLSGIRHLVDIDLPQSLQILDSLVARIDFEQALPADVVRTLYPIEPVHHSSLFGSTSQLQSDSDNDFWSLYAPRWSGEI
ncbi:hypothetical protein EXIGLDRAFT_831433 [Exidia glandulosa HHB12029]|uniref:F-box domain-containing protein n=1 Tax=Exidia glandulosa HHB12029 TaxID=1314781 RepID=A0A165MMN1_EXIGL|nr:hypothetical protein EXIGLDRAFT_831433 [Exidia glandulosa HHB12029]